MIISIIFLVIGSLLGSGILFRHQRLLTLLAATGVLTEAAWLTLTLIKRTFFTAGQGATVFLVGSLVFMAFWAFWWRRWRWPYAAMGSGWRDVAIILVLVPTLASGWLIQQRNGFIDGSWVAHSFYNGDTATLVSLVQRSLTTPGLVEQSPFAGNGPLEYPTLVHAGLAEMISTLSGNLNWLHFLPLLVLTQILIAIPLFFLLRDVVKEGHGSYRWGWRGLLLEAGVIGYVLGVSWESYIYPQGHFFTTSLFIFELTLLVGGWLQRGRQQLLWTASAAVVAILLVFSNAVSGTAAVAAWVVFCLLRWTDVNRARNERMGYLLGAAGLLALFLAFIPGNGGLQLVPGFSYTAAHNMALVALPVALLLAVVVQQLRQYTLLGVTTIALGFVAVVTFLFSSRAIVIDNASRFFYHALLVGWPLIIDSLVRAARVLKARLTTLEGWMLRMTGAVMVVLGFFIILIPPLTSIANVHDHLLYKDVQVSKLPTRLAMEWISTNTSPTAIFLASPNEPWEIPLFTGRAQLRTNYWLSPDDDLQATVNRAFAGEAEAQAQALDKVDYVLLRSEEAAQWNVPVEQRVYHFGGISIYAVAD